MPIINQPSPAPRIPSAFGLGDINPQCVPLSGEFRQTDLGRWSNDDISNGYRLAARQWQEAEILLTLRVTIRVIFAPFRPALINLRSYIQWPDGRALGKLVYRLACNDDVVAFKMGRGKAVRAGLAVRGRISRSIRNRRATQPPAHFQRHPLGRGDPGQDCEER